ncbi:MAG: hypothetical protein SFX73_19455 [Kofleriaceae bacterium]|nr:hypothetical protein [Kofleriaceae bacterium]
MPRITPIARILLGLAFTVFALNYFVPFLPPPRHELSPLALSFLGGFAGAGYMTLIKVIELVAGLALLSNRFVPLALALLAPIIVGIVTFHARLVPGLAIPSVVLVLELYLAWAYRDAFAPMLRAKVVPAPNTPTATPLPVSSRLGS